MNLRRQIASGDRRAALEAIRDKLAGDLEQCEPGQSASLAKQLQAVLAELDSLAPPAAGSKSDELAARRKGRGPAASHPASAVGDLLDGGT